MSIQYNEISACNSRPTVFLENGHGNVLVNLIQVTILSLRKILYTFGKMFYCGKKNTAYAFFRINTVFSKVSVLLRM